jgi:hypothetical protein
MKCGSNRPQHTNRQELHELAWSAPLTAVAPRFNISDVALKKTCAKFNIPVPERGYWARRQAGKPTTQVALPARAAGMKDEVIVGGRNRYWYNQLTNEEILGPLPPRPAFPEDIALVRDRVRKVIGKVSVPRVMAVLHPTVERLIAEDERRRQKQAIATYTLSWEKPVFDSPFGQRRLRFLNALFIATAKCGGKPEVRGHEAHEISIRIHQTRVAVSLDRPPPGRKKAAGQGRDGPEQLRFAIVDRYDRDQVRTSWQDGEGGRLERLIADIAVELATAAEVSYRESCVREFEWRVQRKARLEEEERNRQLELEREERVRRERLEQARIERLLDEAASLRRANDIRAYVDAVRTSVAISATSVSPEEMERWSKWALAQADRIDPVKTAHFLEDIEADDSAN